LILFVCLIFSLFNFVRLFVRLFVCLFVCFFACLLDCLLLSYTNQYICSTLHVHVLSTVSSDSHDQHFIIFSILTRETYHVLQQNFSKMFPKCFLIVLYFNALA
jgi:hypothetical protein